MLAPQLFATVFTTAFLAKSVNPKPLQMVPGLAFVLTGAWTIKSAL